MDKDLLRIVIIAIGGLIILGMILWSVFKNKRPRAGREIDFYDKGNPLDNIDESLVVNTNNDDFDIVQIGSATENEFPDDPITQASKLEQQESQDIPLPNIIQFSIVATADEGFNGKVLVQAFEKVGLEYGTMKIFESLDEKRRVDFAVASMVEPGTFPDSDLESFSSPGIVFFIQPSELDQPLQIFDQFMQTIQILANELDGAIWDHNRLPLSEETVQEFRKVLA